MTCAGGMFRLPVGLLTALARRNNDSGSDQCFLPFGNRSLRDLNEVAKACSGRIDDICIDDEFYLAIAVSPQLSSGGQGHRDPTSRLRLGAEACRARNIVDFWKRVCTRLLEVEVLIAIPQVVDDANIAVRVDKRVAMEWLVVRLAPSL